MSFLLPAEGGTEREQKFSAIQICASAKYCALDLLIAAKMSSCSSHPPAFQLHGETDPAVGSVDIPGFSAVCVGICHCTDFFSIHPCRSCILKWHIEAPVNGVVLTF